MLLIFSFAFDTETNEAAFAGNIGLQQALVVLQNIVVAELVRRQKVEPAKEVISGEGSPRTPEKAQRRNRRSR